MAIGPDITASYLPVGGVVRHVAEPPEARGVPWEAKRCSALLTLPAPYPTENYLTLIVLFALTGYRTTIALPVEQQTGTSQRTARENLLTSGRGISTFVGG